MKGTVLTFFDEKTRFHTSFKSFPFRLSLPWFALSVIALIVQAGCSYSPPYSSLQGNAQGSTYFIQYKNVNPKINMDFEVSRLLEEIDKSMSTYRSNSIITKFNQGNDGELVDKHFLYVLKRSLEIYDETEGAFDVTVAPLVNAWGFGFRNIDNVSDAEILRMKEVVSSTLIQVENNFVTKKDPNVMLDFNAIAQGYTADALASLLKFHGITDGFVEIGGEVSCFGNNPDGEPWIIGIDKPTQNSSERLHTIIQISDIGMATSGSYRKYYVDPTSGKRISHTIDPRTGYPVDHDLLSVTVLADNAMDADAYATYMMVLGRIEGKVFIESKPTLEALFIYASGSDSLAYEMSSGFGQIIKEVPAQNGHRD